MKKIIVVTGGAGFVGTNLIKLLLKKTKIKIISIDNYSSGTNKNHITDRRVNYVNGNTKNILESFQEYFKVLLKWTNASIQIQLARMQFLIFVYPIKLN